MFHKSRAARLVWYIFCVTVWVEEQLIQPRGYDLKEKGDVDAANCHHRCSDWFVHSTMKTCEVNTGMHSLERQGSDGLDPACKLCSTRGSSTYSHLLEMATLPGHWKCPPSG